MTRPLVSVVIPAHNAAATLGRAIESVLAQTFDDWELIVVDDGSTDATADVARRYADSVALLGTPHVGPGVARNRGASVARGEYLAWLDADDVWYPMKLTKQVALARSDGWMDLVSANYHYVDEDGRVLGSGFERNGWLMGRIRRTPGKDHVTFTRDDVPMFIRNGFGATITMMLRRSLFERLGGFCNWLRVAEDIHLVMRAVAASATFGAVCEPLAAYHLRRDSTIRRDAELSHRETIRAYHDLQIQLRGYGRSVRRAVAEPLGRAYLDHAVLLTRSGRRWEGFRAAWSSWKVRPNRTALSAMVAATMGG